MKTITISMTYVLVAAVVLWCIAARLACGLWGAL